MKALKRLWMFIAFVCYVPAVMAHNSPIGDWVTIDDKTGQKRAIVRLKMQHDALEGTITHVYPLPGDTGVCGKCSGDLKNKPIVGLRFLWGLHDKGAGVWEGGHVLDAKNGAVYRARLRVKGKKLYMRGYLGMPILGRTQVWLRADN